MRTRKIIEIVVLTMTLTAVMLFLKSGGEDKPNSKLRNLITDAQVDTICNAAIENEYADKAMTYTQYFQNYSATVASHLIPSNSTDADLLIQFVKTGDTNTIGQYVGKRAAPYLIFIAFAAICLISWLVYCICCCSPCCCCKQKSDEGCYRFLSLVIVIICYTGIVIGCIIGFAYSTKFTRSVNATTCSFLLYYRDVMNGETKKTFPKWAGVIGITKLLSDTQTAIDQISQSYATAFPTGNTWTQTDPPLFEKQLDTSYSTYSSKTLNNPNPASSKSGGITKITPTYIKTYGDYKTSNTALNAIFTEYNTKIKNSITLLDDAEKNTRLMIQYSNEIKNSLSKIQSNVNEMTKGFNQISTNVIDNMVNTQDQVNNNGVTGFLALFAILISLSILSALCLIFFALICKIQCLRFVLHFVWNAITILMILTFLLGGIFGIIGLVGKDGIPVFRWIFGSENLRSSSPKVITDQNTAKNIDICLNGNGDLSTEFVPSGSNTQYLDKLYQTSYTLSTTKNTIKANSNSAAIKQLNTAYGNIQNDITQSTDATLGNNDISAMLSEWRGWTDVDQGKYQKSCSPATYDVWAQVEGKCPSGYTHSSGGGTLGNKNCVLFTSDYSSSTAASGRYSSLSGCQSSGSSDFSTISQATGAYFTGLNQYVTDNSVLLTALINNNSDLDKSFTSMAAKLIASLDKVSGVIDPLYQLYKDFAGDQGLFSIVDCKFMNADMNVLYSQFENNLSPNALSLAGIIIAVSFLEAISVFFLLITIFRYTEHGVKSSEGIDEKKH